MLARVLTCARSVSRRDAPWASPGRSLGPGLRRALEDAYEGLLRVVCAVRLPTRREVTDFLGRQALVNCVAWVAGLVAAGLVTWFFEVRGLRNLWGLLPTHGRALVTAEDYQLILSLASFCAGMSMMVFVRHFLFRWIAETRLVRVERIERLPGAAEMPAPLEPAMVGGELEGHEGGPHS